MVETILTILCVVGYVVVGTAVGLFIYRLDRSSYSMTDLLGVVGGLVWPITIPIYGFCIVVAWLNRSLDEKEYQAKALVKKKEEDRKAMLKLLKEEGFNVEEFENEDKEIIYCR